MKTENMKDLNRIEVTNSKINGTLISLGNISGQTFIISIATDLIINIHNITCEDNDDQFRIIGYYCDGDPKCIVDSMIRAKADILLAFVQDIVEDNSPKSIEYYDYVSGLNYSIFDLIANALEEVHQYYMSYMIVSPYENHPTEYYNRYNKEFLKLFKGGN